jgi:hypothetical protein
MRSAELTSYASLYADALLFYGAHPVLLPIVIIYKNYASTDLDKYYY